MQGNPVVAESAPKSADDIYEVIAGKVRADSQDLVRLTPVEELGPLFPQMTPEEIVNYLGELYEIEAYSDIRATISSSGAAFLFSTTHFTPEEAAERRLADEVHAKAASQVREDSQTQTRLTVFATLAELFPDLPRDQVEKYLADLPAQADCTDIASVTGPTGIRYFYSEKHMTGAYATLLARADANDPSTMIAETVREESRTYPRPTKVTLFYEPVFQIHSDQMQDVVEKTLARVDCADIKKIIAPTGAVYLYSDRYMPAGQAERWVEWEELERFRNP